jgi:hypothetical protein
MVSIEEIGQIAQGWARFALSQMHMVSNEVAERAKKRLDLCNGCHMRVGNSCSVSREGIDVITGETKYGCGCNLSAKSLADDSACPLSIWKQNGV